MFKQRNPLLILAISCFFFASCKKEAKEMLATTAPASAPANAPGPAAGATTAQLNQTAFLQSKDYYLCNTQLPATYDGAAFADSAAVMTDIRKYSTEAGFSGAVDLWSFAMKKAEWNQISG